MVAKRLCIYQPKGEGRIWKKQVFVVVAVVAIGSCSWFAMQEIRIAQLIRTIESDSRVPVRRAAIEALSQNYYRRSLPVLFELRGALAREDYPYALMSDLRVYRALGDSSTVPRDSILRFARRGTVNQRSTALFFMGYRKIVFPEIFESIRAEFPELTAECRIAEFAAKTPL